jgi:hypothetical protein
MMDPSYSIRSVPANPHDSVYCMRLAHHAVHAAMSGHVDPNGDFWLSVLEATGSRGYLADTFFSAASLAPGRSRIPLADYGVLETADKPFSVLLDKYPHPMAFAHSFRRRIEKFHRSAQDRDIWSQDAHLLGLNFITLCANGP